MTCLPDPPSIRVSPRHTTTNESNTVTLKCEVGGKPRPTVKWLKNGFPVDTNVSRITSTTIPGSQEHLDVSLVIQNVSRFDEGVYTCHASNGIGENASSTGANLTVQCKYSFCLSDYVVLGLII